MLKRKRPTSLDAIEFLDELAKILPLDVYELSSVNLLNAIEKLSGKNQIDLIKLCKEGIENLSLGKKEPVRIVCIRILVIFFPESWDIIDSWLDRKDEKYWYEVHFTIFCYLDWITYLFPHHPSLSNITIALNKYLKNAKSQSSRSAWMAGHLLSGHWDNKESLPILLKLSTEANYFIGRLSAVHGIEEILDNRDLDSISTDKIFLTLKKVRDSDRSQNLRRIANNILISMDIKNTSTKD